MDKPQDEKGNSQDYTFLPRGDGCENCGSKTDVQKFDGSKLCQNCRNQYAEIRM